MVDKDHRIISLICNTYDNSTTNTVMALRKIRPANAGKKT